METLEQGQVRAAGPLGSDIEGPAGSPFAQQTVAKFAVRSARHMSSAIIKTPCLSVVSDSALAAACLAADHATSHETSC